MSVPKPTYIFRIVHKENLSILIDDGKLLAPNFANNPKFISIGETDLIRQRGDKAITISPYGTMRDYISFYFGLRSPMLYCIAKGFDVIKRPQKDIIYLISTIEKLEELNTNYIFTDGHSFAGYTQFFNDKKFLNQVDWRTINLKQWNNTALDPDRKRRKEAECLIYKELPFSAIVAIAVYNQEAIDYLFDVFNEKKINLPVSIKQDWYY